MFIERAIGPAARHDESCLIGSGYHVAYGCSSDNCGLPTLHGIRHLDALEV
jgi:hypothetical protein